MPRTLAGKQPRSQATPTATRSCVAATPRSAASRDSAAAPPAASNHTSWSKENARDTPRGRSQWSGALRMTSKEISSLFAYFLFARAVTCETYVVDPRRRRLSQKRSPRETNGSAAPAPTAAMCSTPRGNAVGRMIVTVAPWTRPGAQSSPRRQPKRPAVTTRHLIQSSV